MVLPIKPLIPYVLDWIKNGLDLSPDITIELQFGPEGWSVGCNASSVSFSVDQCSWSPSLELPADGGTFWLNLKAPGCE